jgi:hypothetical protein
MKGKTIETGGLPALAWTQTAGAPSAVAPLKASRVVWTGKGAWWG